MTSKPPKHKAKEAPKEKDDFVSVARRLGADEDKATFEAKLAKIVKQKPEGATFEKKSR
jgi:hypothetical protein